MPSRRTRSRSSTAAGFSTQCALLAASPSIASWVALKVGAVLGGGAMFNRSDSLTRAPSGGRAAGRQSSEWSLSASAGDRLTASGCAGDSASSTAAVWAAVKGGGFGGVPNVPTGVAVGVPIGVSITVGGAREAPLPGGRAAERQSLRFAAVALESAAVCAGALYLYPGGYTVGNSGGALTPGGCVVGTTAVVPAAAAAEVQAEVQADGRRRVSKRAADAKPAPGGGGESLGGVIARERQESSLAGSLNPGGRLLGAGGMGVSSSCAGDLAGDRVSLARESSHSFVRRTPKGERGCMARGACELVIPALAA